MRVRVYLPPFIKSDDSKLDQDGYIELEEGTTMRELFKILKVPLPYGMVHLCRVNYEKASLSRELKDGDTVSFFAIISGG
ncbi:MAG: MoaD/ThiS family protein [Bacillota bacterium]